MTRPARLPVTPHRRACYRTDHLTRDDFRLIRDSDGPTPKLSLEYIQGNDYFTMRIKQVDWENVEKMSPEELGKVEDKLKKDFIELAIRILREKLKEEK
jgi:hypothetical protein